MKWLLLILAASVSFVCFGQDWYDGGVQRLDANYVGGIPADDMATDAEVTAATNVILGVTAGLQSQVSSNDTEIGLHDLQITSLGLTQNSLQSQISSNDTELSSHQLQITTNYNRTTSLQSQVSTNAAKISALSGQSWTTNATVLYYSTKPVVVGGSSRDTNTVYFQVHGTAMVDAIYIGSDLITGVDTNLSPYLTNKTWTASNAFGTTVGSKTIADTYPTNLSFFVNDSGYGTAAYSTAISNALAARAAALETKTQRGAFSASFKTTNTYVFSGQLEYPVTLTNFWARGDAGGVFDIVWNYPTNTIGIWYRCYTGLVCSASYTAVAVDVDLPKGVCLGVSTTNGTFTNAQAVVGYSW